MRVQTTGPPPWPPGTLTLNPWRVWKPLPFPGTIDSDKSHAGLKANIHDDAEDSDGPPQRNLHSGQSGSSSEQSGIDSDQNASQMSMVSSLEGNGEED
jgi:hypothetical protein